MVEPYDLDALDRSILEQLQEDGRKSFRKIADEVGSTAVTVINRVNKMEEAGLIQGYTVDLDYRKAGYRVVAAIEVIVKGTHLQDVKEALLERPNVTAVYEITGDTDILALAKFPNRDELGGFVVEDLLDSDMVEKTITHVAFDTYEEQPNIDLTHESDT